jgi:cysteinyl-tRNA synthetase
MLKSKAAAENCTTFKLFKFYMNYTALHQILTRRNFMITQGFLTLLMILLGCSQKKEIKKPSAAEKMQQFVIGISEYSRKLHPGFIIIPQNGCELVFKDADSGNPLEKPYLNAIDAVAVEELFYNGDYSADKFRIGVLQKVVKEKTVLVAEFISDDDNIKSAIKKNEDEGFICFPRNSKNYDYKLVPEKPNNENSKNITKMSEVKNYLYLINNSEFDTKDKFIKAMAKNNFDMITIDLYFGDEIFTAADVAKMKTKANGGKRLVICYMNAGAAENWRYYWKPEWKLGSPDFLKKKYEDYHNEFWVKYWDPEWEKIIYGNDSSYTKKIIDAGFDGAFLDNAEAYYFLYKNN